MDNISSSVCNISLSTAKTSEEEKAEKMINDAFKNLAEIIIPSKEDIKNGNEILQLIVNHILKTKSKYSIDRHVIVGSGGKKTTIMNSDFDCVVFINDEEPLFEKVLDDFEDILKHANKGYQIQESSIRKTKFSIQFRASGIDFDILPAPNFVKGSKLPGDQMVDEQQQRTLDKIKENPKEYRYVYSSGVCQAAVKFMKKQDGFVNEMVRICKFWYKTLEMPEYISGAKTLIELVAVHAAIGEKTKSYLSCFSAFLQLLDNFDELNISFDAIPNHPVPDYIKIQKPLVLEPANSYNNLAKYWTKKKSSKDILKGYVAETIRRVEDMRQKALLSGTSIPMEMERLFEPQKVAPLNAAELKKSAK